jgi:protein-S-isoprenylcysteine O-methyltransferase Ste14
MKALDFIFIVVSFVWVASEIVLNFFKRSKDTSKDRSSLWVMVFTSYLCTFLGVFIAISRKLGDFLWGVSYLHYLGLILVIFGLTIRWAAIYTLKKQFTVHVAIIENHQVIDTGIYHYVRHPAYLGTLLSFLGLALYFGNWISFIIIFFPNLLAHLNRMAVEERVLIDQFGKEYLNYAAKTSRLIPKIY